MVDVFVDLASGRIGALTPTAGFDLLIRAALDQKKRTDVMLLTCEELRDNRNEMGVVEIGGLEPPTSSLRTTRSPN